MECVFSKKGLLLSPNSIHGKVYPAKFNLDVQTGFFGKKSLIFLFKFTEIRGRVAHWITSTLIQ